MRDIPNAEALRLLSERRVCPDALPWVYRGPGPLTQEACAGLVDLSGNPTGMYVSMMVAQTKKAGILAFQFGMFRLSAAGPERIYQLHVTKWPRLPADVHSRPHEHVGDRRISRPEWLRADYDALLASFCAATNIEFIPPLDEDPTAFRLKP